MSGGRRFFLVVALGAAPVSAQTPDCAFAGLPWGSSAPAADRRLAEQGLVFAEQVDHGDRVYRGRPDGEGDGRALEALKNDAASFLSPWFDARRELTQRSGVQLEICGASSGGPELRQVHLTPAWTREDDRRYGREPSGR